MFMTAHQNMVTIEKVKTLLYLFKKILPHLKVLKNMADSPSTKWVFLAYSAGGEGIKKRWSSIGWSKKTHKSYDKFLCLNLEFGGLVCQNNFVTFSILWSRVQKRKKNIVNSFFFYFFGYKRAKRLDLKHTKTSLYDIREPRKKQT